MANGSEMMIKALRAMIPDNIWEAVERNLFTIGERAAQIEAKMARIEEKQDCIIALHVAVTEEDIDVLRSLIEERKNGREKPAGNGHASI